MIVHRIDDGMVVEDSVATHCWDGQQLGWGGSAQSGIHRRVGRPVDDGIMSEGVAVGPSGAIYVTGDDPAALYRIEPGE